MIDTDDENMDGEVIVDCYDTCVDIKISLPIKEGTCLPN